MLTKFWTKKIIKWVNLILTLFVLLITSPKLSIQAVEGSFGVTGNFPDYHYKMSLDETLETPFVFVRFSNNYPKDIKVQLTPETPAGVSFHLSQEPITIPMKTKNTDGSYSGGTLTVPIGLTTTAEATPGEHIIKLGARVIPDIVDGIEIVGSVILSSRLTIYGEAGTINVSTVNLQGGEFQAEINIYRLEGDVWVPVAYSENGVISDKLIPGRYRIVATYNGTVVAQSEVDLDDKEIINIQLIATTVTIPTFLVGPQFDDETKLFTSVRLAYTISNVFAPVANVRLTLIITFEGEYEEEIDILNLDSLGITSISSKDTYIPKNGWANGLYTFQLKAFQDAGTGNHEDDFFLAESVIREAPIEVPETINVMIVIIVVVGGVVLFLFISLMGILFFGKRKKDCDDLVEKANEAVQNIETIVYGTDPKAKVSNKLIAVAEKAIEMARDCKGIKEVEQRLQKVLELRIERAIEEKVATTEEATSASALVDETKPDVPEKPAPQKAKSKKGGNK